MTFSLAGYYGAATDIRRNGANACNVFNLLVSFAAIGGSFAAGFSGGGFPPQPVLEGITGGSYVAPSVVAGTTSGATTLVGELGVLSLMAKGGGGKNDEVWEYTDPQTGKEYTVGPHGKMPRPRDDNASHHGVMSEWMRALFGKKYNANRAPTVLLPEEDHYQTFGAYASWRSRMAQLQGVGYLDLDWSLITESQIRQLGNEMFDAADVPQIVQGQYWDRFNTFLNALKK